MSFHSRPEAVRFIAQHPRYLISVEHARDIANACGVRFDALLIVEPELVRLTGQHGDMIVGRARGLDCVQVSTLGATLCRYMGLYADRDHALATPHGTLGKQADYVGQRAAIRLARQWWGEAGVRDLARDVPLQRVLVAERRYVPTSGESFGPAGV